MRFLPEFLSLNTDVLLDVLHASFTTHAHDQPPA